MKEINIEKFELDFDIEDGSILRNNDSFKMISDESYYLWIPSIFDYSKIQKLDLSFFQNNNHIVNQSLDIGAGIGLSSLVLSSISNTVDAWEIGNIAFDCLTANLENAVKTHANNVTFNKRHTAITNQNVYSTEIIEYEDDFTKNCIYYDNSFGFSGINSKKNYTLVKQQTIDSYELENVDIINIDTNGYELKVLQGAKDTIQNSKPFLIMNLDDTQLNRYNNSVQEVNNLLNELNYTEVSLGIYSSKQK